MFQKNIIKLIVLSTYHRGFPIAVIKPTGGELGDKLKLFGWHLGDLLYHLRNQGCNLGTSGVTWKPKKCHDDAMYSKPQVLLCFFDMLKGNMNVHMDAHVVQ